MLYIEDLKRAYVIKRNIETAEKEIAKLSEEQKQNIDTASTATVALEQEMLEYKVSVLNGSLLEIVDFIKNCEDSLVSQAMYHRYLKGKTWEQVALSLGGYNSAECIRKMVNRYLDKKGVTKRAGEA